MAEQSWMPMSTHRSNTYQYCCTPIHVSNSKHNNENKQNACSQIPFTGWKVKGVIHQNLVRTKTSVQGREWSLSWKKQLRFQSQLHNPTSLSILRPTMTYLIKNQWSMVHLFNCEKLYQNVSSKNQFLMVAIVHKNSRKCFGGMYTRVEKHSPNTAIKGGRGCIMYNI